MRRLPLVTTARRATSRLLNATEVAEGPLQKLAIRARHVASDAKQGWASLHWARRPECINLEVTAICDARCIHCPRHEMDRSQRPMELELFKRIIDQAADLRVPTIAPNGFGEVLTMRNLEDYLAYIRSKAFRFEIHLNTNGFRMDAEKRRLFLDYEVDLINVTLDGATAETFEAIREKLLLSQIEENVHALLAERKKRGAAVPRLRIGIIVIPQNEHEIPAFLEKWHGVADYVGAGGFTNRGGSLTEKFHGYSSAANVAKACVLPFRELNIWADGKAVLCCDDWNEDHVVGDLNVSSIREVWHGAQLRHARRMHSTGQGAELPICSRCNMWRAPTPLTRLWV